MEPTLRGILFIFLLSLFSACEEEKQTSAKVTSETRFPIRIGDKPISIRLAITDAERQKGLMHIESMPEHEGMLFLFMEAKNQGFWMMNTNIPLDIGYFTGDGVLREVHRMYPKNLSSVKSRRNDIQYALEMNQGWYRENGVQPGAKLHQGDVSKALKARWESPEAWGFSDAD